MFKSRSLRGAFSFMAGNILVFSVTDLLGNFARAMVFPYASLYILALVFRPYHHGDLNHPDPPFHPRPTESGDIGVN